ncbi:MAG: RNA polymerase sigma-70 factor (ECF subfamily) [Glaciecola sp.]|jgi:RNA polymerase sigma-70 factor (ECF subfamily)
MTQQIEIDLPLAQCPPIPIGSESGLTWSGLEEHRTSLQRYLQSRCTDENDIADIIQESFLRAARYRRVPMDSSRLRGWLMRIASNVQVDKARGGSRGPTNGLAPEIWENIGEPVQEEARFSWGGGSVVMEEALVCLRAAESELREQDRKVLDEYYLRGSGTDEIAGRLGVSSSMVKVRLFRARRRLKSLLEKRFRLVGKPTLAWA